jgi:hypothetical protein
MVLDDICLLVRNGILRLADVATGDRVPELDPGAVVAARRPQLKATPLSLTACVILSASSSEAHSPFSA